MVDDSPLPDGTTSPQSALVLIRGRFGFDGPDQMLADASRAVELETDSKTPWYAVARSALGYAGYVIGDVELAREALTTSMRAPAAPAITRMLALGTLALCGAEQGRTGSLTPRQLRILQRLRGTQTQRGIAADLHISHNTVKTITSSLYRKLGAHSRKDALVIARPSD